jgi:hypothetical protein
MDIDVLGTLRHPEYECFMPQSGERFVGHEAWADAHRDYLSHFGSEVEVEAVRGGDQRAEVARVPIVMPFAAAPIIQVADTGDLVTIEGKGAWPDGKIYHFVFILEYRDGLVRRETQYYAEPFPAPEWRARLTQRGDG